MTSSAQIRAGRAYVELSSNDSKLVAGLNAAKAKIAAFGKGVNAIGAGLLAGSAGAAAAATAIVAPLALAVKAFTSMGDAIAKASTRTGASAEKIGALGYAAEQSGADMDTLVSGIRNLQGHLADAIGGNEEAIKSFADLGLSVSDLASMSPDEQFRAVAEAIGGISDPARRSAAAMALLGKGGIALLPMLTDGAAGVDALTSRYKALGLEMSEESAKAAEHLGDTFDDLGKVIKNVAVVIGSQLAPFIQPMADWMIAVTVATTGWLKENRATIAVAAVAAVGLGALSVALAGTGVAFVALGAVASAAAAVVGIATTVISGAGAVLAALVSPVGLIVVGITAAAAGIALLGVAVVYWTGLGGKAVDALGEAFAVLKKDALAAWGAIGSALAAGDLGAAMGVAWSFVKLEWTRGLAYLTETWIVFKTSFLSAVDDLKTDFMARIAELGHTIEDLMGAKLTARILTVWNNFFDTLTSNWTTAVHYMRDVMLSVMGKLDPTFNAVAAIEEAHRQDAEDAKRAREQARARANDLAARAKESPFETQQRHQRERDAAARAAEEARAARMNAGDKAIGAERAKVTAAENDFKGAIDLANSLTGKPTGQPDWVAIHGRKGDMNDPVGAARNQFIMDQGHFSELDSTIAEMRRQMKDFTGDPKNRDNEMLMMAGNFFGNLKLGIEQVAKPAEIQDEIKRTIGVRGTFSAIEASRFGTGGATDALTQAAQQTAKNTKKIVEKLDDAQPNVWVQ